MVKAIGLIAITAILATSGIGNAEEITLTASWYSIQSLKDEGTFKYSKGVMSNGKLFNDMAPTCGCRLYNLGDTLRITVLDTGKSVIIKVTDRIGKRFAKTRIDLSRRAFEILSGGRLDRGLLQVKVEKL